MKILQKARVLCNSFFFKKRLKKYGKKIRIYKNNRFEGLENVIIGDDFSSLEGLWLGTYSKYYAYSYNPLIQIGNDVHISRNTHIGCINGIVIKDNVLIGSNVLINDHMHGETFDFSKPRYLLPLVSKGKIVIGENCFIGDNVCIFGGVTIGKNCVVAANSVVNKSFPDNCLIAGSPAVLIKKMEETKNV